MINEDEIGRSMVNAANLTLALVKVYSKLVMLRFNNNEDTISKNELNHLIEDLEKNIDITFDIKKVDK